MNIQLKPNSETQSFDPSISRNKKNLPFFCPKFLDLYASIYGTLYMRMIFSKKITRFVQTNRE